MESSPEIFVSTACLTGHEPLAYRLERYQKATLSQIEIGFYPTDNLDDAITAVSDCDANIMLHCYFPVDPSPIIFNLASSNSHLRTQSIDIAKRSISLSNDIGAKFYSLHAGFISDPHETSGAFVYPETSTDDQKRALEMFLDSIHTLLSFVDSSDIALLIENNVCTEENRGKLLAVTPNDLSEILGSLGHPKQLGILLDVGHLKVSANTENFQLNAIEPLSPYIQGVHFHDNDSFSDLHKPVERSSELYTLMNALNPHYITIESHHPQIDDLVRYRDDLINLLS